MIQLPLLFCGSKAALEKIETVRARFNRDFGIPIAECDCMDCKVRRLFVARLDELKAKIEAGDTTFATEAKP